MACIYFQRKELETSKGRNGSAHWNLIVILVLTKDETKAFNGKYVHRVELLNFKHDFQCSNSVRFDINSSYYVAGFKESFAPRGGGGGDLS